MTQRRQLFVPSQTPMVMVNVALAILAVSVVVAASYGLTGPNGNFLQDFSSMMGLFCLSSTSLVMQVAAWVEKRPGAKLLIGLGSILLLILSVVMTSVSMAFGGSLDAIAGLALFSSPFLLVYSVPTLIGGVRLGGHWREATQNDREAALLDLIGREGGMVTYQQVARQVEIPRDEVDPLLRSLIEQGRVKGERLTAYERFYTPQARSRQELLILGKIEAEGTVYIEDVSIQYDLPQELVKEMIYALVERKRFTGYINWDKGRLYSTTASKIKADSQCPNCHGRLTIAGRNIVQCDFCSAEIFLAE